jgi:hypothetical protein
MAGNANSGRREKPFAKALAMEIAEAGENAKALRNIAKVLIAKAEEGDLQAIKEFIDRTDGKAPQAIIGGDEDDPAVRFVAEIRRTIVRPDPGP